MPRTMILQPLDESTLSEIQRNLIKQNFNELSELLNSLKYDEQMSFEQYLDKLGFTEQQYIMRRIRFVIILSVYVAFTLLFAVKPCCKISQR